jgi:hypothetical protein
MLRKQRKNKSIDNGFVMVEQNGDEIVIKKKVNKLAMSMPNIEVEDRGFKNPDFVEEKKEEVKLEMKEPEVINLTPITVLEPIIEGSVHERVVSDLKPLSKRQVKEQKRKDDAKRIQELEKEMQKIKTPGFPDNFVQRYKQEQKEKEVKKEIVEIVKPKLKRIIKTHLAKGSKTVKVIPPLIKYMEPQAKHVQLSRTFEIKPKNREVKVESDGRHKVESKMELRKKRPMTTVLPPREN